MARLPEVTRTYRSWILDSTRWRHVDFREGDIVVTTPYKSGTTWMLQIAGQIIFDDLRLRAPGEYGRWVDAALAPIADELAALDAMRGRRVFKTHLGLDTLPYHPDVRYIYVARDLRDVFMSLWHHHTSYKPEFWSRMVQLAADAGAPMPSPPGHIREFWRDWTTRGYFEWERDGYPYWSPTGHLSSWWEFRHLPNLLFVHFNDLLTDLPAEIGRVASFVGLPRPARRCVEIAERVSFGSMKREAETVNPGAHVAFRGGPATFINKGTNGRWRGVLTDEDLDLHEHMLSNAPPDAVDWLRNGTLAMEAG